MKKHDTIIKIEENACHEYPLQSTLVSSRYWYNFCLIVHLSAILEVTLAGFGLCLFVVDTLEADEVLATRYLVGIFGNI